MPVVSHQFINDPLEINWSYIDDNQFEQALDLLDKAIHLFPDVPDTAIKFYSFNVKLVCLLRLKRYEEALRLAESSIHLYKNHFGSYSSDALAEALSYKAEASLHTTGPDSALPFIDEALKIYLSFYKGPHKVIDQAHAWIIKGDCFLGVNDYKKALAAYAQSFLILEILKASKKSKFCQTVFLRLIYTAQKLNLHNIIAVNE